MYTRENRHLHGKRLLSEIIALSDNEKANLAEFEKIILSGTVDEKKSLADNILKNDRFIHIVFKFYSNSNVFKKFCNENQFSHFDAWKKTLTIAQHTAEITCSVDRKKTISILDQYFAAFFFSEYLEFKQHINEIKPEHAEFYLDLASEIGLFKAIVARCEENQYIIKSPNTSNPTLTDAFAQLRSDLQRLGNLYWSVGFFHAAKLQLDIGIFLANKEIDDLAALAHLFKKDAALSFLQGREIATYSPLSQNDSLIKTICGEKNLAVFGFESMDKAQEYFLEHVDNELSPHVNLVTEAKTKVRNYLNVSRSKTIGSEQ